MNIFPFGACTDCDGLGTEINIDPDLVVPNHSKSLIQGCIIPIGEQPRGNMYSSILKSLASHYKFSFTTPWSELTNEIQKILLYGTPKDSKINMIYSSERFKGEYKGQFEGVIPNLQRRYTQTRSSHTRDWIEKFMAIQKCISCNGARLKKSTLAVKINRFNILICCTWFSS